MSDEHTKDALTDAIIGLLPMLLQALDRLGEVARALHPPQLAEIAERMGTPDLDVRAGLDAFQAAPWPDEMAGFRDRIVKGAEETISAYEELRVAAEAPDGTLGAYRALRHLPRAMEALYPLCGALKAVSQFFLEPGARSDEALLERLDAGTGGKDVGILHAGNERGTKGGFSLFVPETYDPAKAHPLIVALHGGSGHGRDFLWTWVREARTRGALLLSPTSQGDTWSLMGPDIDTEAIEKVIADIKGRWTINPDKILMTGMSDGGTFTYVSGLLETSPFTHLAPISASFHPMLAAAAPQERMKDLPIYIVHGALDWMFAARMARAASIALQSAGADVTYRLIPDLSHTYPREENARILDWFLD